MCTCDYKVSWIHVLAKGEQEQRGRKGRGAEVGEGRCVSGARSLAGSGRGGQTAATNTGPEAFSVVRCAANTEASRMPTPEGKG